MRCADSLPPHRFDCIIHFIAIKSRGNFSLLRFFSCRKVSSDSYFLLIASPSQSPSATACPPSVACATSPSGRRESVKGRAIGISVKFERNEKNIFRKSVGPVLFPNFFLTRSILSDKIDLNLQEEWSSRKNKTIRCFRGRCGRRCYDTPSPLS